MKIGIVGSGMISGHHLTAASRYPGAVIVGIADRDIGRAKAQAERFGVSHTFRELGELLALEPDIVHILTPPGTHAALNVQACELMTRAAQAANRQICVGHCWLYSPAMLRAQELIASGVTGEVLQATSSFNFDVRRNASYGDGHWASDLPGGLAEGLAVHPASILIRLLGGPKKVMAVSRSSPSIPNGGTADARALVEGEHGLGTLAVSLRARPDMGLVDISCARALLRLN